MPRPSRYRAPSWSWASVDEPVAWGSSPAMDRDRLEVTILDAQCILASLDPTGAVSVGHITLLGRCR
jgi:hypothetical protein